MDLTMEDDERAAGHGGETAGGLCSSEPPADPADTLRAEARTEPVYELNARYQNRGWRSYCMAERGKIPAGYTYLGQLIGHDLGSSVRLAEVPYAVPEAAADGPEIGGEGPDNRRYNLIENPLTLETVYGPGPSMLNHVYRRDNWLFRVEPGQRIARPIGHRSLGIRPLYDGRNRDTLMLHELTVFWMQYHNRIARDLLHRGMPRDAAYGHARRHVVRVWHGIIRADYLPRLLHDDIAAMPEADLLAYAPLDEITLLHGLFRAFHAMPRGMYRRGPGQDRVHLLRDLMLDKHGQSMAERAGWRFDWNMFLRDGTGGTTTGMSSSLSFRLALAGGAHVRKLDLRTAEQMRPLGLLDAPIARIVGQMPQDWSSDLAPGTIAAEFTAAVRASPVAGELPGFEVTAEDVAAMPLFKVIEIEAQIGGTDGRMGRFGSLLLRRSVEAAMRRVRFTGPELAEDEFRQPKKMIELIDIVEGR